MTNLRPIATLITSHPMRECHPRFAPNKTRNTGLSL
jgi:hypothetical protein